MAVKGAKWFGTFIDGKSTGVFWEEERKQTAREGCKFAMRVHGSKKEVRLVELTVTAVYKVKEDK